MTLQEIRQMDIDETAAYNLYAAEKSKTKKQKLYKAFKAIQEANEDKRFILTFSR
jgi:hypothetical protein